MTDDLEVSWADDEGGVYTVTGRADLVSAFLEVVAAGPGPVGCPNCTPEQRCRCCLLSLDTDPMADLDE